MLGEAQADAAAARERLGAARAEACELRGARAPRGGARTRVLRAGGPAAPQLGWAPGRLAGRSLQHADGGQSAPGVFWLTGVHHVACGNGVGMAPCSCAPVLVAVRAALAMGAWCARRAAGCGGACESAFGPILAAHRRRVCSRVAGCGRGARGGRERGCRPSRSESSARSVSVRCCQQGAARATTVLGVACAQCGWRLRARTRRRPRRAPRPSARPAARRPRRPRARSGARRCSRASATACARCWRRMTRRRRRARRPVRPRPLCSPGQARHTTPMRGQAGHTTPRGRAGRRPAAAPQDPLHSMRCRAAAVCPRLSSAASTAGRVSALQRGPPPSRRPLVLAGPNSATSCLAPATWAVRHAGGRRGPRIAPAATRARAGGAGGAPHAAGQAARMAALEAALAAAQAAGAAAEAEAGRARGAAAAGAAGAAAAEARAGEARAEAAAAAREAADLARQVALLEVRRVTAVRARVAVVPTCGASDLASGDAGCPLHGWAPGVAGVRVTWRSRGARLRGHWSHAWRSVWRCTVAHCWRERRCWCAGNGNVPRPGAGLWARSRLAAPGAPRGSARHGRLSSGHAVHARPLLPVL